MHQIFIPTSKGNVAIELEDIIRVEASSNYSKIYLQKGYPLTVAKVLYWFEERLPKDWFYRIHATHIVNRQFVKRRPCPEKLELANGEQLRISRPNRKITRLLMKKIAAA